MEQLYRALIALAGSDRVLREEPMSRHTTMRVGGPAELCFLPAATEEILEAISLARKAKVPFRVIGNGSNLIVRDGGLPGLTVILGSAFSGIEAAGEVLTAQAGATLGELAERALKHSLTGLEFASGIPGTVGGGTAMNAGAYGGQISDVLLWADVTDEEGNIARLSAGEMEFGYRISRPLKEGLIVLRAAFGLHTAPEEGIRSAMRELASRRREKQPLDKPSAGSVFKRPEGHFAGALIEQAGLKGTRVGGACVSEKHAGFIVNEGGATARDVTDLIRLVQKRVFRASGVELECEVRILGVD